MKKFAAMIGCALLCASLGLAAGRSSSKGQTIGEATRNRPAGSQMTGSISQSNGKFFMTDEATRVTSEVRGSGLEKFVGKKVTVQYQTLAGESPAAGATQVVTVSQVNVTGAGKAAAAGVKGGISKGAMAGLIGAGGAGATLGGLYAADVIGSEDQSASRR